jgi:hypothetical protein
MVLYLTVSTLSGTIPIARPFPLPDDSAGNIHPGRDEFADLHRTNYYG